MTARRRDILIDPSRPRRDFWTRDDVTVTETYGKVSVAAPCGESRSFHPDEAIELGHKLIAAGNRAKVRREIIFPRVEEAVT